MCGIAGIIALDNSRITKHRLKQMTDTIIHRGPEGEGFWINTKGNVGLGHRRLCIIDLSDAGGQPMHYLDRYTITYNGEIYNYLELKEDLKNKGYAFRSECDTEVILAAYAHYGKACLDHFDGMFAFALWDEEEQKLFCARDRFGEKPFYYYCDGSEFLFASEMKALWSAGIDKNIDDTLLLNYLTIGYTSDPSRPSATFFKQVQKLPPSNCLQLTFSSNEKLEVEVNQYWDLDKETQMEQPEAVIKEKFIQLLTTSVSRRLRSDVPVGSSLSGGLDSSTIVALINSMIGESSKQKTFSAVFPGYEKDESKYISQVADIFSIDSFTTTPSADDFITEIEKLVYHQEEPFQSSSIYAQYKVYELARQNGVTVILDGQGADEVLAGYTKYFHWYWQQLIAEGRYKEAKQQVAAAKKNGVPASWNLKNIVAAWMPGLTAQQLEKKAFKQQKRHPFIAPAFLDDHLQRSSLYKPVVDKLNDILYYNTMQFGLEELLRYADRNSMAHSREVRLPFLSHELVQFVFSLPAHYKIRDGFSKYILRSAMNNMLPRNIVWRKDKIGYEPPQQQWMQKEGMKEMIMESRRKLVGRHVLKPAVLNEPVRSLSAHEADNFDWRYLSAAAALY